MFSLDHFYAVQYSTTQHNNMTYSLSGATKSEDADRAWRSQDFSKMGRRGRMWQHHGMVKILGQ